MNQQGDQLLTTSDVARLLNVSPDTVRYLERRGRLRAQYTPSGQRIFRRDEVERVAHARRLRSESHRSPE